MKKIIALTLCACLLHTSCSMFASSKDKVIIRSSDPNATLRVDDEIVGYGNTEVRLASHREHIATADLNGRHAHAHIGRELSLAGKLDIVGTMIFLIPGIGLLSNGCYKLDRDTVYLELPPSENNR